MLKRLIAKIITVFTDSLHWGLKPFLSDKFLNEYKFIHLCWWFDKHGFETPKYFIGTHTPPSVTTSNADPVGSSTATLNGNVTSWGNTVNNHERGFYYSVKSVNANPTSGGTGVTTLSELNTNTGAYSLEATSLTASTTYCFRAFATGNRGTGEGSVLEFTTSAATPAAPTNVSATDGTHTDKVVVTWTKSVGATGYKVYEGTNLLDTLGDVATYDDTAAGAPTITAGSSVASDGTSTAHVALSLSGTSANNGATRTYKVVATNAVGDSADSATDTGYRGVGSLGYQWYRSSGDSDTDYSVLTGATTASHNDTTAPADGSGRYYKCYLTATGATATYSSADRGYRDVSVVPTVTTSETFDDITATSATANGNLTATGGAAVTRRGFCYMLGTTGDPTTANSVVYDDSAGFSTGTYTKGLSSLDSGKKYRVRAYAVNSVGTGYGTTQQLTLTNTAPTVALNSPEMLVNTYYFDGSIATLDPDEAWRNEENAVDGSTTTVSIADGMTNTGGSNTVNELNLRGTNIDVIPSSVRLRAYAAGGVTESFVNNLLTIEVWTQGGVASGESLGSVSRNSNVGAWTGYISLSTPTGGWTLAKAQNLEAICWTDSDNSVGQAVVYKVELEVTELPTVSTTPQLEFTGTDPEDDDITYEVELLLENGLFAAVGFDGVAHWSDDGKTWTTGTAGSTTLLGVAWSPSLELFAAVGTGGVAHWSDDGKTWTTGTAGTTGLRGVAWSPELELFAVVGSSGAVRWSDDGKTWTDTGTAGSTTLNGIAWSPELELFAAVGDNGAVRWSDDGKTWTTTGTAGSTALNGIAWSPYLLKLIQTALSDTDVGFINTVTPADVDPFNSGERVRYTVQTALDDDTIYYWRVRGKDPTGSDTYGDWSATWSFTTSAAEVNIVLNIISNSIS